jgi:hypothetical protein
MFGLRYIALVPMVKIVRDEYGYGQVVRDDDGNPVLDRYAVHHNGKLYETEGVARREANAFRRRGEGNSDLFGRVLVADLDAMQLVEETEDEREARLDTTVQRTAAELAILRDQQAGRAVEKTNRDYDARVRRTYEIRDRASFEIRKLLEAFRPPTFVIQTRKNHAPTPCPERTWFGNEHDALAADPNTWIACLRDVDPKGSDAHIYVMARTENGALAKLLAHILDGGGFFPMT